MNDAPIAALIRAAETLADQADVIATTFTVTRPYRELAEQRARQDAAALRAHAKTVCPHPDDSYQEPEPENGRVAWCRLCDFTWPRGEQRAPDVDRDTIVAEQKVPDGPEASVVTWCDTKDPADQDRECFLSAGHTGEHNFVASIPF